MPAAIASASTSVDLPEPFSPTSTVQRARSSPSASTCATAGMVSGQTSDAGSSAPRARCSRRAGSPSVHGEEADGIRGTLSATTDARHPVRAGHRRLDPRDGHPRPRARRHRPERPPRGRPARAAAHPPRQARPPARGRHPAVSRRGPAHPLAGRGARAVGAPRAGRGDAGRSRGRRSCRLHPQHRQARVRHAAGGHRHAAAGHAQPRRGGRGGAGRLEVRRRPRRPRLRRGPGDQLAPR